jgi:hypothetical protein
MAGFFQDLLKDTAKGFFGSEYLRDYTHASKTFRTNAYAYSPKFKFLFHVYFDINTSLIGATDSWPKDSNFGLAVKTVQLPKFSIDTTSLNQYNRKRIIQTKVKYDPVQITFHDDNAGLIRKLWHTYYTYYYKDAAQMDVNAPSGGSSADAIMRQSIDEGYGAQYDLSRRNIYDASISGADDWGYVGEGSSKATPTANLLGVSKAPFFKSINVFGFNQHNFAMYKFINPIIDSFQHDQYSYSESGTMQHTMNIQYETVKYYDGALDGRNPGEIVTGFGDSGNYDRNPSPISRPGSQGTILGQGGLIDAAGGIMDDLAKGNILGAAQKAGAAANTFKNPANILQIAKSEAIGVAADIIKPSPNRNTPFNFPTSASSVVQNVNGAVNGIMAGMKDYASTVIKK